MVSKDFIDYGLAFIEGFALIVSPCILPILPIILSGGLAGGRRRPIGIIIGFTLFFALFSLLSGTLIRYIGVDLDVVRKISYGLIILFGIILMSDFLSNFFSRVTQGLADKGGHYADKAGTTGGLFSGILFGGLVSLIWVPCAGPILAAAIVQMAVQKTFLTSFITFMCFAFGSVLPMVLIMLIGKKLLNKVSFLKTHAYYLRKIFGAVIIIAATVAGFTNVAAKLAGTTSNEVVMSKAFSDDKLSGGLSSPYLAPALNTQVTWINSSPLTMAQLKGKVVLIDFWTYSCINCIRTLPYLRDWYNKYHDQGLVIIGVHAPEFEFEKNADNVKQAILQNHIQYPVVLDNQYVIWQRYDNRYWPAHYLIDKNGMVVYQHFGEGHYAQTEHNIQVLLGLTVKEVNHPIKAAENVNILQTPETYLGSARSENYQGIPSLVNGQTVLYQFPTTLSLNAWALKGEWMIQAQSIQSVSANAAIKIHFYAKQVYAVMGSVDNQPIKLTILLNGQVQKEVMLKDFRLYTAVTLPKAGEGELELQFDKPGVQLYTFTFGN